MRPVQPWADRADRVGGAAGPDRLREALATVQSLVAVLEADQPALEE